MNEIKEHQDIESLDGIQTSLENGVFNYAIEETHDLYDEEDDELVRAIFWSVGLRKYGVIVNPLGFMKAVCTVGGEKAKEADEKIPADLYLQIAESIHSYTTGHKKPNK